MDDHRLAHCALGAILLISAVTLLLDGERLHAACATCEAVIYAVMGARHVSSRSTRLSQVWLAIKRRLQG